MASALRFVQSFELLLKSGNLQDLEFLQIDASALYLLARPSTPEEVRREVLERAKTEPVSHVDVAQAIGEAIGTRWRPGMPRMVEGPRLWKVFETPPTAAQSGENYTVAPAPPDAEIVNLSAEITAKEPAPPVVTGRDFHAGILKALARDTEDLILRYHGALREMKDVEHHFTEALKIVQEAMKRVTFTIVH